MNIRVQILIGSDVALNSDQGKAIRDFYGDAWRKEDIILDFEGVKRISPSFLSQALLPLLNELPPERIRNAVMFLSKPPAFDYAWENILKAVAERVKKAAN